VLRNSYVEYYQNGSGELERFMTYFLRVMNQVVCTWFNEPIYDIGLITSNKRNQKVTPYREYIVQESCREKKRAQIKNKTIIRSNTRFHGTGCFCNWCSSNRLHIFHRNHRAIYHPALDPDSTGLWHENPQLATLLRHEKKKNHWDNNDKLTPFGLHTEKYPHPPASNFQEHQEKYAALGVVDSV
jgi:hypothetical protein